MIRMRNVEAMEVGRMDVWFVRMVKWHFFSSIAAWIGRCSCFD
jgi:hypothetical protein